MRGGLGGTGLLTLALGVPALAVARPLAPLPPSGDGPVDAARLPTPRLLRSVGLVLLGLTAFASLVDEIAWTRILVMIVGGSTYAFTLVLLVFLLGIGIGSRIVAHRSVAP